MNFKEFLGQIFFPRSCVACGIPLKQGVICPPCLAAVSMDQTLFCAICDARLPAGKKTCHPKAPCVIGGAGSYADPTLKKLVRQLKFKGIREAAIPLAEIMTQYLSNFLIPYSSFHAFLLIPIPLSRQRHNERGYNQAEEIARRVAMTMRMTMTTGVLTRIKNTKPQTEMGGSEERLKNLHDCFRASPAVAGKNILLVDDVTTSGATLREAARALKAAGARKIIAIAAAKA